VQESADVDVLHMRLETLQKQVEDQQEHICVLRDSVSLKDRQADMLHSDVRRSFGQSYTRNSLHWPRLASVCLSRPFSSRNIARGAYAT